MQSGPDESVIGCELVAGAEEKSRMEVVVNVEVGLRVELRVEITVEVDVEVGVEVGVEVDVEIGVKVGVEADVALGMEDDVAVYREKVSVDWAVTVLIVRGGDGVDREQTKLMLVYFLVSIRAVGGEHVCGHGRVSRAGAGVITSYVRMV